MYPGIYAARTPNRPAYIMAQTGTQRDVVDQMQTRQELYDLLSYEEYNRFDQDLYNFKV